MVFVVIDLKLRGSFRYNRFMEIFTDALIDAVHDTWSMIPLLFLAYLLIEYFERKPAKDDSLFWNLQKYGPLFGAALGLLPQCGFSVLAAMLYLQKSITLGTMISVFIATSDEAIPILISEPSLISDLAVLLVLKFILAVAVGFVTDHFLVRRQKIVSFADLPEEQEEEEIEEDEEGVSSCPCCYPQYPMWLSALIRTAKIYLFVFITTLLLNILMIWLGDERLSAILLSGSWIQILIAALFGFIPNCAATVVLCQLFAAGSLSFASLFAGLCTNAGLGLLVFFQYDSDKKVFAKTLAIMYVSSIAAGYLIELVMSMIH